MTGVKQIVTLLLVACVLFSLLVILAGCTGNFVNEKAVGAASVDTGSSADQVNQTAAQTIAGAVFGVSTLVRQK